LAKKDGAERMEQTANHPIVPVRIPQQSDVPKMVVLGTMEKPDSGND
jgi:hypothetical protein